MYSPPYVPCETNSSRFGVRLFTCFGLHLGLFWGQLGHVLGGVLVMYLEL